MRKLFTILMLLALAGSLAAAAEKPVHGPTKYLPLSDASRADGDDCVAPIVLDMSVLPFDVSDTTCGRGNNLDTGCLGSYAGGEDIFYLVSPTMTGYYSFDFTSDTSWTGIAIADNCGFDPCLGSTTGAATDGGIQDIYLEAGTDYYVMLDTWPSPDCINAFTLTVSEGNAPPEPPANDVCEGAIDLNSMPAVFDVDQTDGYTNVSAMGSGGCTGYTADGPEAFYKVYMSVGEDLIASIDGSCDLSMYLFTDCADPFASCVAGSDVGNPEAISYVADADGWYYLAVDAYSGDGCLVTLTVDGVVANEDMSFSTLKADFR